MAMPDGGVYLDNASTSFPKPDVLWQSARDYLTGIGASPGRASYRQARQADDIVERARAALARLIGAGTPRSVAFTANATHALNIAIKGTLSPGDHVVTTDIEHNSVLRPLDELSRAGQIGYTAVRTAADGRFDLDRFRAAMRPQTRLVVVNHASNVTGVVAPIAELATLAREHGALFLLDASQTAGFLDIDVDAVGIDLLALTGHKCLRGPSGTGALYVRDASRVRPLHVGGSGINSQSLRHPAAMPAKFEAGTANYLGIAGLGAVVGQLTPQRLRAGRDRALELTRYCLTRLRGIDGITTYDPHPALPRVPVISLVFAGLYPSELCAVLDRDFAIMTRAGLHCAPLIHQTLGTVPHGTLRISLGTGSTRADVDALAEALQAVRERVVATSR